MTTHTQPLSERAPRALIAEDSRTMRMVLAQFCLRQGYEVMEAENGAAALGVFMEFQPDIVLLDGMMPIMDGFTACARLKSMPGGVQTPVLMVTVLEDDASVNRAFEVGASDFITKPINWAVLRNRMRRLLEARDTELSLRAVSERLRELIQARRVEEALEVIADQETGHNPGEPDKPELPVETAIVSEERQITLPDPFCAFLGIEAGQEVYASLEDDHIEISPFPPARFYQ